MLVREIDEVQARVEAVVPRTHQFPLLDPERRIGCQPAAPCIEPELGDEIGAGDVLRRLQHIVLDAGDVRHKDEAVRGIGRNRVGTDCRLVPVDWRCSYRSIRPDRMHRDKAALVIGTEQVLAGAVRCAKSRRLLR